MAVTLISDNKIGLTIKAIIDSPADYGLLPNNTYFKDLSDGLIYWKDGSGVVKGLFDGSASGILGISNASGEYTYYSTLAAAEAAVAVDGVVEMFTNLATTTQHGFNKKYTLNGNGYAINNNAATGYALATNNFIVINLTNLKVNCTGGADGINAGGGASRINADDSVYVAVNAARALNIVSSATVVGGNYKNISSTEYAVVNTGGTLMNVNVSGYRGIDSIGGTVRNSFATADFQAINLTSGAVGHKLLGYSNSGSGISADTNAKTYSSEGISNIGVAIIGQGGAIFEGCKGLSLGLYGWGGLPASNFQFLNDCTSHSLVSLGGQLKAYISGGKFTSEGSRGLDLYGGSMEDVKVESKYNNAAGHAIYLAASNLELIDCKFKVANAGANCIWSNATATNAYIADNKYRGGATVDVEATITNVQANPSDTYGNTKIG